MTKFYNEHPIFFTILLMLSFFGLAFAGAGVGLIFDDVRIGELFVGAVVLSIPLGSYIRHRARWGIKFSDWYMKYW